MEKKEKEGEEGKKRKKEGGKGEEDMWASGGHKSGWPKVDARWGGSGGRSPPMLRLLRKF